MCTRLGSIRLRYLMVVRSLPLALPTMVWTVASVRLVSSAILRSDTPAFRSFRILSDRGAAHLLTRDAALALNNAKLPNPLSKS